MTTRLLSGPVGAAASFDLALGPALLAQLAADDGDPWLRFYRPSPTVAFTARDRLLPGFSAAVQAARDHGFTPVRRSSGGRAAAYTDQALCVDHIGLESRELPDIKGRFADFGALLTEALQSVGVDARLGEIPGEYCPGEFSVNGAGRIKLVGTAQRMVRRGWLFGVVIVFSDSRRVRDVLTDVYGALDVPWDPTTAGAVTDLNPELTLDRVQTAVLNGYAERYDLAQTRWPNQILADARLRESDHAL